MKYFTHTFVVGLMSLAMITTVHAGSSVPITLTIMDSSSYNVHSDGKGAVQPNLYIPSVLPNGDPCVSGATLSNGYTVFYPDVKFSNGTLCNTTLPASEQRTYIFLFPFGNGSTIGGYPGPCQYLNVPETIDAFGNPAGYCTVDTDPLQYERIILGSPFSTKPSTGQIRLSLNFNGIQYGVITDTVGNMLTLDANKRLITYTGAAKLYTASGTQLTYSFNLPFQMQVQKYPQ